MKSMFVFPRISSIVIAKRDENEEKVRKLLEIVQCEVQQQDIDSRLS